MYVYYGCYLENGELAFQPCLKKVSNKGWGELESGFQNWSWKGLFQNEVVLSKREYFQTILSALMNTNFIEIINGISLISVLLKLLKLLTLSWRWSQSYRNQPIDLQSKSMDWFLYDRGLRHERVDIVIVINGIYDHKKERYIYLFSS